MSIAITDVYSGNFKREIHRLMSTLWTHRTVAVDTEFPGFLYKTPRDATQFRRYQDLRFNVASLKLIQVGFTVFDDFGTVVGVWQFNFCDFDVDLDVHDPEAINLLKRNGIDFEKNRSEGVPIVVFASWLKAVLVQCGRSIKWVTFHGIYDIGYLIQILIQKPLPPSVFEFSQIVKLVFGRIFDVKVIAECCPALSRKRNSWGLQKLADFLDVKRVGQAHQAGSDSWVTAAVFDKVKRVYGLEEKDFVGVLYGIELNIAYSWMVDSRRHPIMPFVCHRMPMFCTIPVGY